MSRALLALFSLALLLGVTRSEARPAAAGDELDAFVNAFYLAEGKLADFDAELDRAAAANQPALLARSSTYKDLIALRMILDGHAHALAARLGALPPNAPELTAFRARLDGLDLAEEIAVNELLPELGKLAVEFPEFFSDVDDALDARELASGLILERMAKSRADSALNQQVTALAASLDFSSAIQERQAGAGGAPTLIQPSDGPNGTISGASFPANTWALTYDDGPSERYTPTVLQNLTDLRQKASFMWLVQCLKANPALPAKVLAAGMSTNDHSWTHEDLAKATASDLTKEITQSAQQDQHFYGAPPRFFRLPYGAGLHVASVRKLIAKNGMIHVFWNVDSLDWQDKDPQSILARVQKEMALEKHGIILFHDIHPQSVQASRLVLEWSATLNGTAAAQRWVTLPAIVDELNHAHFTAGPARGRFSLASSRKLR